MPLVGESDCGIFAFRTGVLFQVLERARAEGRGIGAMTREWNLLPLLPGFEQPPGSVQTIPIDDVEQTLGINRRTDVDAAARVLARRAQGMCS